MDGTSRCIFCRGTKQLESLVPITQGFQNEWSYKCIESISNLFQIPNGHPFQLVLENAICCNTCRLIIQDLDLTLRQLNTLVRRMETRRTQLYDKLHSNYEMIPDRDTYTVKYQDIEHPTSKTVALSYNEIVKTMFEKLRDESTFVSSAVEEFKKVVTLKIVLEEPAICTTSRSNSKTVKTKRVVKKSSVKNRKSDSSENKSQSHSRTLRNLTTTAKIEDDIEISDDGLKLNDFEEEEEDYVPMNSFMLDDFTIGVSDPLSPNAGSNSGEASAESDDNSNYSGFEKVSAGNGNKRKKNVNQNRKAIHCDVQSCSARFFTEDGLMHHKRQVHEDDPLPFHCNECPKKLKSFKGLSEHKNWHKKKKKKKDFFCVPCNRSFIHVASMERHNQIFHKVEIHRCSYCCLECETDEERQSHEDTHNNCELPFTCTVCNIVCTNSIKLQQHVKLTHCNKNIVCDVCGKTFSSNAILRKHRTTHDESYKGFKCDVCGLVARDKNELGRHKLKHLDTKSCVCEICGKSFTYPSSLVRHKKNHDKVFPYVCRICKKGFKCKYFLVKHEEIHSGTMSYQCQFCSKMFKTDQNLRQHEKTHEPKDPLRKQRICKPKKTHVSEYSGSDSYNDVPEIIPNFY